MSEKRNPICPALAGVANAPWTCVNKKSERKKSGQNNVGTKNWPTGDGCSRPSKLQAQKTEIQIQNWGPRPRERVQNKNFYLNGKNQQMQRKTI